MRSAAAALPESYLEIRRNHVVVVVDVVVIKVPSADCYVTLTRLCSGDAHEPRREKKNVLMARPDRYEIRFSRLSDRGEYE